MIGFDVNYGNPTFISHGENGYLIPIDKDDQDVEVITNLCEKIVQYFNTGICICRTLKLSILRKNGKIYDGCYMINLFEIFDEASQRLQQSLQFAGFKHETIVMDDDGFTR